MAVFRRSFVAATLAAEIVLLPLGRSRVEEILNLIVAIINITRLLALQLPILRPFQSRHSQSVK